MNKRQIMRLLERYLKNTDLIYYALEKDAPELLERSEYESLKEYDSYIEGLGDGAEWAFSWILRKLKEGESDESKR